MACFVKEMSKSAGETTSLTSLYPLTHFPRHGYCTFSLAPYNDVGDVVSQALLLNIF